MTCKAEGYAKTMREFGYTVKVGMETEHYIELNITATGKNGSKKNFFGSIVFRGAISRGLSPVVTRRGQSTVCIVTFKKEVTE